MNRIKTREKAKGNGIKVLDKSAAAGQRMKNAFIRSKRNSAALMDDRQDTPSEYAEDKAQFAADDLVHDTANVTVSGTKTAVRQGRKLFQCQREKKAAEKWRENTTPMEQPPHQYSGVAPDSRLPRQRTDAAPEQLRPKRFQNVIDRNHPRVRTETECPADTADTVVERGRVFVKKRFETWAERRRQERNLSVQSGRPAQPQGKAPDVGASRQAFKAAEQPVETVKQSGHVAGQTIKSTGKATERTGRNAVKNVQRTIKTNRQTAKWTVTTTGRTSRATIKTAEHTAKAAQKTAQAARVTAKTAITAAKASAKAVSTSVKAIVASIKALVTAIAAGGWIAILAVVIICLIGLIAGSCFGIFFSGEDSGTGQTMPAVVREINQDYEAKLEEIKTANAHDTLEMSGSRAVWSDVLAIYAVKTTTDPDNPQEVATMDDNKKALLKEIFWAMNEVSSRTATSTATQTVETDDGAGNIIEEEVEVTTTTLHITVVHKTADEMADVYNFTADQRAQLAELLAEENRGMWSSVLYGIDVGDGEIVVVALSQIGNVGGELYWSWYGFTSRVDWCACFVSWCANECGYLESGAIPRFASCSIGIQWFQSRGLWQDKDYEPRPGDIIFFDWDNEDDGQDGVADHVGIVEKVENGVVYTVEGNSGNSCQERQYAIRHYEIYGYGTPTY